MSVCDPTVNSTEGSEGLPLVELDAFGMPFLWPFIGFQGQQGPDSLTKSSDCPKVIARSRRSPSEPGRRMPGHGRAERKAKNALFALERGTSHGAAVRGSPFI
ncbi:hypothetical protein PPROV_000892400 [Pycnococcus provasolii]|uniref:Uncharacterized protein n=1 Tax=Pycnococcus provasolii TaxID=41880 RepID=A0A830HSV6_9CHLO|nr:hypothetical protein PPROV_000892400 [Pycnococcus provasolii]